MVESVRCLTTSVDMMTSILHKIISTGTVAAKLDMEGVPLEALEASKACMDNPTKGMECLPRLPMINTPRLQQMLEHLVNNTRLLAEIALPQEV